MKRTSKRKATLTALCFPSTSRSTPPSPTHLQPRINLIHNMRMTPRRPIPTRLRHDHRDILLLDIPRPFEDVDVQARTDVPSDVAVERPDARVVGRELQDLIGWDAGGGARGEDLNIPSLRVGFVGDDAVPDPGAGGEDEEVVPVSWGGKVSLGKNGRWKGKSGTHRCIGWEEKVA